MQDRPPRATERLLRRVSRAGRFSLASTAPDDADGFSASRDAVLPAVVAVGAASFDLKGRITGDQVFEGSSNAGMLASGLGGTARNIAENLARLDIATSLIAAVGDDVLGRMVERRTARAGVNTDCVRTVRGGRTGAYFGLLTPDGDLLMGIDDMDVVRRITPRVLEASRPLLRAAGMVVLDANVSVRTLRAARRICGAAGVPVCIEPVSLPLMGRIAPWLPGTALFTPNVAEAEAILDTEIRGVEDARAAAITLHTRGIALAVVTLGGGGAVYATREGSGHVPAIQTDVVDESGAGAAMTAGIICGLMHGFPADESVGLGAAAASLTLLSSETVRSDLSLQQVYEHLVV